MSDKTKRGSRGSNFGSVRQSTVPHSRNGKHRSIITKILSDLGRLDGGDAIKIPLDQLDDTKANVRSALNRATRKRGLNVKTASDDQFLYVWPA